MPPNVAGLPNNTTLLNYLHAFYGVGALMSRFISGMGGTSWANISTQYYQYNYNGNYSTVGNPKQQLAGVWHDDTTPIHDNLAPIDLAREAARAVAFFHATDLADSNFVIATPQKFNDAGFNQNQYCAWHDFTTPTGYPGVQQGVAFTNMPYVLNAAGGCGKDFVNPTPTGDLDGVTIGQAMRQVGLAPRRRIDHRPGAERRLVRLPELGNRRQVRVGWRRPTNSRRGLQHDWKRWPRISSANVVEQ